VNNVYIGPTYRAEVVTSQEVGVFPDGIYEMENSIPYRGKGGGGGWAVILKGHEGVLVKVSTSVSVESLLVGAKVSLETHGGHRAIRILGMDREVPGKPIDDYLKCKKGLLLFTLSTEEARTTAIYLKAVSVWTSAWDDAIKPVLERADKTVAASTFGFNDKFALKLDLGEAMLVEDCIAKALDEKGSLRPAINQMIEMNESQEPKRDMSDMIPGGEFLQARLHHDIMAVSTYQPSPLSCSF